MNSWMVDGSRRRGICGGISAGVLIGTLCLGLAGCGAPGGPTPVILISIDTCRPDRLGCYGQARPITPAIDAFARDGLLFTHATAAVPLTLPSHCSMLTGMIPPLHGVHDNAGYRLSESHVTLAEQFRQAGYRTGAVVGSFVLDHRFGLAQGFDWYEDRIPVPPGRPRGEDNERPAAEVTRLALDWLNQQGSRPFFLFVHYYDPHAPYRPSEPYATRWRDDPYGGEIAAVDGEIGRILERLRQLKLYSRAVVVITSDHAEALGEHGESAHSYFIYDSTVRVPLLVKAPGIKGGSRTDRAAALVDLVRTICAYAGIAPPAGAQGEDLSKEPTNVGAAEPAAVYLEALTATKYDAAPLRGVVSGRWKYILSVRSELYDLRQDPGETENLLDTEGATAARLNGVLEGFLAAAAQAGTGRDQQAPDQETRERLASLGYISGRTVNEGLHPAPGLVDAKDRIEIHEACQTVLELTDRGDFAGARERCRQMMQSLPSLPDLHLLLGDVEVAAGQPDQAVAAYRRFLDLAKAAGRPANDQARGWYNLANALATTRDQAEAVGAYRQALALDENNGDAWFNLGVTLAETGRVDEAAEAFARAVQIDPANPEAQYNLGVARAMRGDGEAAAKAYEAALGVDPKHSGALLQLAGLELRSGRAKEALARLRGAAAAHPERPEIAQDLAWILATHEDPQVRNGVEAERIAQQLVAASHGQDPRFLESLAAAKAEQGRYQEAAALQARAVALLPSQAPEQVRAELAGRLALYRQGRPARTRF